MVASAELLRRTTTLQGSRAPISGSAARARLARAGLQAPKDDVIPDGVRGFSAKLGFEGGPDVDFRQDSEPLRGKGFAGAFHGFGPGKGDGGGQGVGHDAP